MYTLLSCDDLDFPIKLALEFPYLSGQRKNLFYEKKTYHGNVWLYLYEKHILFNNYRLLWSIDIETFMQCNKSEIDFVRFAYIEAEQRLFHYYWMNIKAFLTSWSQFCVIKCGDTLKSDVCDIYNLYL